MDEIESESNEEIKEDFKLLENRLTYQDVQECALCEKLDMNLIGPFVSPKARTMEYWFHHHCLSRNEYS